MSANHSGQSIVITGASSGIGKACALHFDGLGFKVFAGVRREQDASVLREVASERLVPILLDVTSRSMIGSAMKQVTDHLDGEGLNGLVNNAGVSRPGPIEFQAISRFRDEIEVNLIGAVAVTQAFLPLIRREKGRIVNISSVSGFLVLPLAGTYAASKFGLKAITDSFRLELRPWGISVSIVELGAIDTPIWEKLQRDMEKTPKELPEACWEYYGPLLEEKSLFRPEGIPPVEVARAVEHAITSNRPKSRYIVGRDAKFLNLVRRLPASMRDVAIHSQVPDYGRTN